MKRSLRIVKPTDDSGGDTTCTMEEALHDLMARIIADQPSVIMAVWEKPDGVIQMSSLPGSNALMRGLVLNATDVLYRRRRWRRNDEPDRPEHQAQGHLFGLRRRRINVGRAQILRRPMGAVSDEAPMIKTRPPVDTVSESGLAQVNANMAFLERLFAEKFDARDRALTVALATMDVRLEGMNEIRNSLRDQSALFVTRDEYVTAHAAVVRNTEAMRIELSTSVVRVEQADRASAVERAQLDKRLDAMNEFRLQLKDQAATLISRSEVTTLIREPAGGCQAAGDRGGRKGGPRRFDRRVRPDRRQVEAGGRKAGDLGWPAVGAWHHLPADQHLRQLVALGAPLWSELIRGNHGWDALGRLGSS